MQTHRIYTPEDKMIELIADDFRLIQVMSRFGIKVGFGDNNVETVCRNNGVDCKTFLAVINFIYQDNFDIQQNTDISLDSLLHYLRQSHIYFLEYCFPAIRRKLLDGIRMRTTDISFLILKFFDEYTHEVHTHMQQEEKTVFIYVRELLNGHIMPGFELKTYSDHHEQVGDKLGELKNIILKYCPDNADANLLNDALYDIYRCESDLQSHCRVEDCLFVPAIINLENKLKSDVNAR